MPKKGEYVKFKNCKNKIKSQFLIYADFESILVPEDNGKRNPENVIRANIKNMFCKHFKLYLGEDAVYNFINSFDKKVKTVIK